MWSNHSENQAKTITVPHVKSKDPSTCNGEDFTWVNVIAKELFFCPGWVKVVVEGSKLRNVA